MNENAGDDWANHTDYKLTLFVLRKDEKKWKKVRDSPESSYSRTLTVGGLNGLLLSLESASRRRRILNQEEAGRLRAGIRESQSRLKALALVR
ncbi:MAG: hypothetical protein Q8L29_01985 [archaeon]|nr:hypothetical protein [archaeon]